MVHLLNDVDISFLENLLMPNGVLVPVPAASLKEIPQETISVFCVKHGIYQLATNELVYFLRQEIGEKKAIEVGAGNGVFGRALGIPMYDNMMQTWPVIKSIYDSLGQCTVPYGMDVICKDGLDAVVEERPEVVVASWVTQKTIPGRTFEDCNDYGFDEEAAMYAGMEKYIHIGNAAVHGKKEVLKGQFLITARYDLEDILFSRSMHRKDKVVYIVKRY